MKLLTSTIKKHPLTIFIGFAIATALIFINWVSYRHAQHLLNTQTHLREALASTVKLSSSLLQTSSAHQIYLLTQDERDKQAYLAQAQKTRQDLRNFVQHQERIHASNSPSVTHVTNAISAQLDTMETKDENAGTHPATQAVQARESLSIRQITEQLEQIGARDHTTAIEQQKGIHSNWRTQQLWLGAITVLALMLFLLHMRQRTNLQLRTEKYALELETERQSLEKQIKQRTAHLRELATNLQMTSEQTRSRLARELHDELGSLLTATKLHIARIKSKLPPDSEDARKQVDQLNQTLNQVIAIKRRIIEDLRPSSLENFGLVIALDILQSEFHENTGISIETQLEDVELDPPGQLALYRIVQESLNNISKYAQATHVVLNLQSYPEHIELLIQDNGVGFDQHVIKPKSHGVAGMRHRVESLRGRLQVTSAPGKGTSIFAIVPHRNGSTLLGSDEPGSPENSEAH